MNKIAFSLSMINWSLVGFGLSLCVPSLPLFQKYLGYPGIIIYLAIVSLVLFLFSHYKVFIAKFMAAITKKQVYCLIVATFLILVIGFLAIYPKANPHIFGHGTDCDYALNIASTRMLHGQYPYYVRTYLGNAVSPMPGTLIFSIPFVLLGSSAYQNIFWLLMFFIAMRLYLKNGRLALLLLWLIIALSPTILYQLAVGIDYISNSIYVLLFMIWLLIAISRTNCSTWIRIIPAILLGIGLSSRANFLFLLPLLFFAMLRIAGWKSAIGYSAIICFAFALITMPFYLYDPKGFSPLLTRYLLKQFESVVPLVSLIIPLTMGILSLLIAIFQSTNFDLTIFLRNCVLVLGFPVLCGIILSSIKNGRIDFGFASYGTFFIFFGAVAFWSNFVNNKNILLPS
jgi:hypothetical protein